MAERFLGAGLVSILALAATLASPASADVSISNKPTANMSCAGGVCMATAQKAVLNASDLQTMLAAGDVAVKTGSLAKDIDVDQPLAWATTSRFTLDAQESVVVTKPVNVTGTGGLTITTNDGGDDIGDVFFFGKGNVTFWDVDSSLIINGNAYVLVGDIKTLAAAITANPVGFYALAASYDAKQDGAYSTNPVPQLGRKGIVEGLGNAISHFTQKTDGKGGLFLDNAGMIRDLRLNNAHVKAAGRAAAALVPFNHGVIVGCYASGSVSGSGDTDQDIGGLVGNNERIISGSHSAVDVSTGQNVGGLVGSNGGRIQVSYASGTVLSPHIVGGLVGDDSSEIIDSYATGAVAGGMAGGLVGRGSRENTSYSTGMVRGDYFGGFTGEAGVMQSDYWDVDSSGTQQGCGSDGCSGVTGLTSEQLQSGLPSGFDKRLWAQNPKINNGYPYLLRNPPQ